MHILGKFIMVQEPLGVGGGYWLPAGRVDPGEKLTQGAIREALEEAGIHIEITGVLHLSLTNALRVIFLANPVQGRQDTPKTVPDFESAGAMWISAEDVQRNLPQSYCRSGRATEPLEWFPKVADGERGMNITNPHYHAFENIVLELCQTGCTLIDIKDRFLPVWKTLQCAFYAATKQVGSRNNPSETPEALYKNLIL